MNLMSEIKKRVQHAFDAAGFANADILVKVSDRPDMSDYQSNGALPLAKQMKQNPRALAEKIADILRTGRFFQQNFRRWSRFYQYDRFRYAIGGNGF